MKKQFTVVNAHTNLDTVAPIGTALSVYHDKNNAYDAKALRVRLKSSGEDIGFVSFHTKVDSTKSNQDLFDLMKEEGKLDGFDCIVSRQETIKLGDKLNRNVLVIEPV